MEKSAINFSKRTPRKCRNQAKGELGITSEAWSERYMGLSVHISWPNKKAFSRVKDILWEYYKDIWRGCWIKYGSNLLLKLLARWSQHMPHLCFFYNGILWWTQLADREFFLGANMTINQNYIGWGEHIHPLAQILLPLYFSPRTHLFDIVREL